MKKKAQRAQVAVLMIFIVVVLILAIAATAIIGETGFQRIRLANIADSALVSAVSQFCRTLNQVKIFHNRMLLNYIELQSQLLYSSPFTTKWDAYLRTLGWAAIGLESNWELYNQAKETVEDVGKELRTSLYDSSFGGGLIDEPKPFIDIPYGNARDENIPAGVDSCNCPADWDEVKRDPEPDGKITFLNYTKYSYRDAPFNCQYRQLKKSDGGWYKKDALSYSFNKYYDKEKGGIMSDEPLSSYDSYLRVRLIDVPNRVKIKAQVMILFFFYCTPCKYYCCFWPGIIPHPWAWIRKIDIDSKHFGLEIKKKIPFKRLSVFGKDVELTHTSRVGLRGSHRIGFDFKMEE